MKHSKTPILMPLSGTQQDWKPMPPVLPLVDHVAPLLYPTIRLTVPFISRHYTVLACPEPWCLYWKLGIAFTVSVNILLEPTCKAFHPFIDSLASVAFWILSINIHNPIILAFCVDSVVNFCCWLQMQFGSTLPQLWWLLSVYFGGTKKDIFIVDYFQLGTPWKTISLFYNS